MTGFGDQDLVGARLVLQPCRHVYRIPDDGVIQAFEADRADVARHHFPASDTYGNLGVVVVGPVRGRHAGHRLPDRKGGFDGAVQVVFPPEDGHDGIPDEFIHVPFLGDDLLHNSVKVGIEHVDHLPGRGLFADGGKAAEVDEHDGGLDLFAGRDLGFVFLPAHEIQDVFIHIHPQNVVFLDRPEGFPDLPHMAECLFHGDGQVLKVDGLGDKVKGTPVHGGADVVHVPVGRDDDRLQQGILLVEFGQQGEPVHLGHVDVAEHQVHPRILFKLLQGLGPIVGKQELVYVIADLPAEFLLDEYLQVRFVIHYQYLGHQFRAVSFSFRSEKSRGLVRKSFAPSRWAVVRFCSSP